MESTIAKKPVTVSGTDAATQVGAELAELSYTVSGLIEGETLTGVAVTTNAEKDTAGEYKVTVTVSGENPNYELTTREGKYTVTTDAFVVVAKDKYLCMTVSISAKLPVRMEIFDHLRYEIVNALVIGNAVAGAVEQGDVALAVDIEDMRNADQGFRVEGHGIHLTLNLWSTKAR